MASRWFSIVLVSVLVLVLTLTNPGDILEQIPEMVNDAQEFLDWAYAKVVNEYMGPGPVEAAKNDVSSETSTIDDSPVDIDLSDSGTNPPETYANPPVPDQGGTCIEGNVVDHYHQSIGNGWEVEVVHEDGRTKTVKVDASGHFWFSGLEAGEWTVTLGDVPEGWQPITPRTFTVSLSGRGSDCAGVRYKELRPACLNVRKLDNNGKLGLPDKVGIPGWEITVSNGTITREGVTDGLGNYHFDALPPDVWTVQEESKVGWIPSLGYPDKVIITLESPTGPNMCEAVTFVNEQIHEGCIDVCKEDVDGNPLSNWEFRITRDDGTQPSATKTADASGCVRFTDLALGKWTIQEKVEDWWRPVGDDVQTVDLTVPGTCERLTFQNEPLGCIDGYKINHLDQGLSGWTIRARNADTGEEFSTMTDLFGYFKFEDLPLGKWIVLEEPQQGWEAVTPSEFEVTLNEPFTCQHVRFKNRTQYACVDVFKKDAWDGAGLAGWEIIVQPAYGGSPVTGVTDGTGYVRFNGLTPGTYDISERVQSGWVAITPVTQRMTLEATGTCAVLTFKNRQDNMPCCEDVTSTPETLPTTGADAPPPTSEPTPTPAPAEPACRATHTVQRGDTLFSIARSYQTNVAAVKQANNLTSNTLSVGQQLCIP